MHKVILFVAFLFLTQFRLYQFYFTTAWRVTLTLAMDPNKQNRESSYKNIVVSRYYWLFADSFDTYVYSLFEENGGLCMRNKGGYSFDPLRC